MFEDWLLLDLEEQKDHLERYLQGLEGDNRTIISTWVDYSPFTGVVPPQMDEAQRQNFLSNLNLILQMLNFEYCGASGSSN